MKHLYTLLTVLLLSGGMFSCEDDKEGGNCAGWSGPDLTMHTNGGGCYYEDGGTVHTYTDPDICACAK